MTPSGGACQASTSAKMLCIEAHERRSVFEPAQIALLASVIDVARSHEILFEVSELELHTGLKLAHARMDAGTPADEYLRRTEKGGLQRPPLFATSPRFETTRSEVRNVS
jgi:hypothetical protein